MPTPEEQREVDALVEQIQQKRQVDREEALRQAGAIRRALMSLLDRLFPTPDHEGAQVEYMVRDRASKADAQRRYDYEKQRAGERDPSRHPYFGTRWEDLREFERRNPGARSR